MARNTNQAVTTAAQNASQSPLMVRFAQVEREAQRIHEARPTRTVQAVMSRGQIHVLMKDAHKTVEFFGADVAVTVTQPEK